MGVTGFSCRRAFCYETLEKILSGPCRSRLPERHSLAIPSYSDLESNIVENQPSHDLIYSYLHKTKSFQPNLNKCSFISEEDRPANLT